MFILYFAFLISSRALRLFVNKNKFFFQIFQKNYFFSLCPCTSAGFVTKTRKIGYHFENGRFAELFSPRDFILEPGRIFAFIINKLTFIGKGYAQCYNIDMLSSFLML